ncbi:MAG: GSCFA domain-containing protein [Chitinophagales bacterium]
MQNTFRITFSPAEINPKINYNSRLIFAGSCFSENISEKLKRYKFSVLSNPFGIIYNPFSLLEELQMILSKRVFSEADIFQEGGIYRSFYMHSRISHPDKEMMLNMMNKTILDGYEFLKTATHLVLTPGTARVYVLKSNGKIVANNHKQPANLFDKRQLHFSEVNDLFHKLVNELQKFNPQLSIIFTVSPVRHLKDGAAENMHSKAILIASIHEVIKNSVNTTYFPAYELMMDDLRDYRFYAEDMLHPNTIAVDYIFEKFQNACIDESTYNIMKQVDEIKTAMQHKPFFPELEQYKKFKETYLQKVLKLQKENAIVDLREEVSFFRG